MAVIKNGRKQQIALWRAMGTLVLLTLCGACGKTHDHQGKTPLVEVAGNYLYREDVEAALPLGISSDDSVRFVRQYMRKWVEETLFYEKAQENILGDDEIAQQVEDYRRSLVLHAYRQALIQQKLMKDITESDIEAYYHAHASLFKAEHPLIKGLFIKVPLTAPQLGNVRRWYQSDSHDAVEHLEKYSLRNAVKYEYFYDKWKSAGEVLGWMPQQDGIDVEKILQTKHHMELQDTAFHYFLHVTDYLAIGEEEPYDVARVRVRELLLNERQADFLQQMRDDLYRHAEENNEIKYY